MAFSNFDNISSQRNINVITKYQTNKNVTQSNTTSNNLETNQITSLDHDYEKELKTINSHNGIIEKIYNFVKNKTHLGHGSDKVLETIQKNKTNPNGKKEIEESIDRYQKSQKNAQQGVGDLAAVTGGIAAYSGVSNFLKNTHYRYKIGSNNFFTTVLNQATNVKNFGINKIAQKVNNEIVNLKSGRRIAIAATGAAVIGGLTKVLTLATNRITSKEFKIDKEELKTRKQEIKNAQKELNEKKNTLTKEEYKQEKARIKELKNSLKEDLKDLDKQKRNENLKNFATGALYGVLSPITEFAGGIPGIITIIGTSTIGRGLLNKNNDEKYSLSNLKNNILDNSILNAAVLTAATIPLVKHVNYNKVLDKNLVEIEKFLNKDKLNKELVSTSTAYTKLENMLVESPAIKAIRSTHKSTNEKIDELTNENIFAVKMMQISDKYGEISQALREDCPASRTIEQAKEIVAKTFEDRFELTKRLGVGTVAETYLAKDKTTGKEVCLKLIKEGITPEKIEADKQKMIKLIDQTIVTEEEKKQMLNKIKTDVDVAIKEIDDLKIKSIVQELTPDILKKFDLMACEMGISMAESVKLEELVTNFLNSGKKDSNLLKQITEKFKKLNILKINEDAQKKINDVNTKYITEKEKQTLINNIEDLAKGISQEVNLTNEMNAANRLKNYSNTANVVNPILVKDNIYVMEKANGISLKTLQEIINLEDSKMYYEKRIKEYSNDDYYTKKLNEINKKIEDIKSKSPDFDTINLTQKEVGNVLDNYMKVISEQFDSIKRNGKTIHADIHPGNVFVDLNALKQGKKKVLTLIDTGNTIEITKEQSQRALQLQMFLKQGNVSELSKYIMEDAILPKGMTKEKSIEIMENSLKRAFFDNKTAINIMTRDEFFNLADAIMQEHNIVSGGTQLNLEKAKTSANKSFKSALKSFTNKKVQEMGSDANDLEMALAATAIIGKISKNQFINSVIQEIKNIKEVSPIEYLKNKFRKGNIATNSKEYLTYQFKQGFESDTKKMIKNTFGDIADL